MSVRNLLLIALPLAAVSIGCTGSPTQTSGVVTITQTTSTTTTTAIPQLTAGAIGTSPKGTGLVAATLYTFLFVTPPSGGVPPYSATWDFGDGGVGAGNAPSHQYNIAGNFVATVTVTDSKAASAQASLAVSSRNVTGSWNVTFPGSSIKSQVMDMVQNQAAVAATMSGTGDGLGTGTGSVSNPRSLSVTVTFGNSLPLPYALAFNGSLDDALLTWTGTVTGFAACPCAFTATRPSANLLGVASSPSSRRR
jgi:hypothetical protein